MEREAFEELKKGDLAKLTFTHSDEAFENESFTNVDIVGEVGNKGGRGITFNARSYFYTEESISAVRARNRDLSWGVQVTIPYKVITKLNILKNPHQYVQSSTQK